jgi:hypothetical protein
MLTCLRRAFRIGCLDSSDNLDKKRPFNLLIDLSKIPIGHTYRISKRTKIRPSLQGLTPPILALEVKFQAILPITM